SGRCGRSISSSDWCRCSCALSRGAQGCLLHSSTSHGVLGTDELRYRFHHDRIIRLGYRSRAIGRCISDVHR
ncbi:hypothetical protein LTS00_018303, partial [Friedmanniomyces endolithicus]